MQFSTGSTQIFLAVPFSCYDRLYPLYRDLYFALGRPDNSPLGRILPELIHISESMNRGKTVSHCSKQRRARTEDSFDKATGQFSVFLFNRDLAKCP
jgi:hypothetical protein